MAKQRARTLRWATQVHPITGQEVADLDDVMARPVTDRERRKYADLAGVRGRSLYITVDDAETQTNGGFLVASSQGHDETAIEAEARNAALIRTYQSDALGRVTIPE